MRASTPLLGAAAVYVAGLAVAAAAPPPIPPWAVLGAALVLCVAPFARAGEAARSERRGPRLLGRGAILVSFGLCGLAAGAPEPHPGLSSDPAVRPLLLRPRATALEGTLREVKELDSGALRLTLRAERIAGRAVRRRGARDVRLTVYGEEGRRRLLSLLPGDRLRVHASLRAPRSFGNTGALDYERFLRRQGIALLGSVKSPLRVHRHRAGRWSAARTTAWARVRLRESLERAVQGREGTGLLLAMVWGHREGVPPADRRVMIAGGTYHLVAISGLHVGLVAWSLLSASRALGLGRRASRGAVLAILPVYAALTGGSPPVVRAAWMAAALLGAGLCGRRAVGWNALGLAALASLAAHPPALGDAGLQLSFTATGAILLLARPLGGALPGPAWLRGGLAASLSAFLGIAPLLALHGGRPAPVSAVAGVAALPLASGAVLGGASASLLESLHPGLGAPLARAATACAVGILSASRAAAALPGGSWPVPPPPMALILAYYALLLLAGLRSPPVPLRAIASGVLLMSLAALLVGGGGAPPSGRLRIDFLDVGQGDAALVRMPGGETILVDAGGVRTGGFDLGERVVLPALWRLGVRRIDIAVGTHAHRDHLGGLPAVIGAIPTAEMWLASGPPGDPDVAAVREACLRWGTRLRRIGGGLRRRFGAAEIEVVHPAPGFPRDDANEASVVLRLHLGRRSLLLTGDAGEPAESAMLALHVVPRCDLLKVGHHGSRSGSSSRFLREVRPRLAVISVGSENPWGHPARAVIERLRAHGSRVLRTDRHGQVTVETDGERLWWWTRQGPGAAAP